METFQRFAVRVKGTNLYFPEPKGILGRGGSHTVPTTLTGPNERMRLFHSARAAKIFITTWRQGTWHKNVCGGDSWEDDYWEEVYPKKVPSRDDIELEIVTLSLSMMD